MSKIKKVKEFILTGPPQFEVLMRRKYSAADSKGYVNINIAIIHPYSTSPEEITYHIDISETRSTIKRVRRLEDNRIFTFRDLIELKEDKQDFFIIEFKEDLVHCVLIDVIDLSIKMVKINEISRCLVEEDFLDEEEKLEAYNNREEQTWTK